MKLGDNFIDTQIFVCFFTKTNFIDIFINYYFYHFNFIVTPEDYEPPGFGPTFEPKFSFPEKTMKISLGKVDTDNHG